MYNEEAGAARCVASVSDVLTKFDVDAALVVVDDGSDDATLDRLETARACSAARVDIVVKERNEGYGAALRTGAGHADSIGAEWVIFMDSDLTNPPDQIPDFVAAMTDGVDLIKACRYCAGGGMIDVPLRRRIVSRAGNVTARAAGRWATPRSDERLPSISNAFVPPAAAHGARLLCDPGGAVPRSTARATRRRRPDDALRPLALTYGRAASSTRSGSAGHTCAGHLRTAADRLHLTSGGRR